VRERRSSCQSLRGKVRTGVNNSGKVKKKTTAAGKLVGSNPGAGEGSRYKNTQGEYEREGARRAAKFRQRKSRTHEINLFTMQPE